ncbi:DNA-methyltransferase [Bacillus haynesii]|uniref:DNA-methyltransferase n=1 Tax=Bacillus haynesii TaxID=1925021 RepID=UPI00228193D5|nr:DNA methyltransferase [Bacillus haynesii]MCY7771234.1 methyltransferase domain-containing protein [Bacillus haynesii]MCY8002405.1 methyltransferase domain-containing protein [Bacillus haynesii]MCY8012218.1 methyltransferase domain-containing protein [Bacillus haynesii]MCY9217558.1 methyltransferase domain-containing protein [Bacillus haynesii]MEC0700066.1 DNA methyltransferase [Bacillus haynesii]
MSIFIGDCLEQLKNIPDETVDLIYLDPPFYTQRTQKSKTRDNLKEYSFEDSWESIQEYFNFIKVRLIECHRVLKKTGSIFLHCDKSASHYLRVALDEVFGMDKFQSEIIWAYKRWSNSKIGLLNNHQTIYFYSKTNKFKFNKIYTDYSATTNIDQILQDRVRNENAKSAYKLDENGKPIIGKEKKGVPLSDVWNIPFLNPKAKERTGYPTQKPILLLEQILKIATDEGDVVLDPFCGSGTTLVTADIMNRQYIGIDISEDAIELTKQRLENPIKTTSHLLKKGEQEYLTKTEEELAILNSVGARPVQRNKGIDGFLKEYYEEKPVPIKIQKPGETLEEAIDKLITASKKRDCVLKILIRTNRDTNQLIQMNDFQNEDLLIIDSYDFIIKSKLENGQVSETLI